jgi:hypothetical protein
MKKIKTEIKTFLKVIGLQEHYTDEEKFVMFIFVGFLIVLMIL